MGLIWYPAMCRIFEDSGVVEGVLRFPVGSGVVCMVYLFVLAVHGAIVGHIDG